MMDTGETLLAAVAQQEMWVGERLGAGPAYRMPLALWLDGDLDVAALSGACEDVIARHPVLATTVTLVGRELRQAPAAKPPVTVTDASAPGAAARLLEAETQAGFNLATGPLARFTIAAVAPGRHLLLVVAHHIVYDGMSTHILVRDLARYYTARLGGTPAEPEPLSFAAAAAAGRERAAAALPAARQFWAQRPAEPSPAVLPGPLRPAPQYGVGMAVDAGIDPELGRDASGAADAVGTTTFEVLVAAAHALLFRYGARHPAVAVDVTARQRGDRDLIGPFINELPVVSSPAPGQTFRELALDIRRWLREAYQFRDVPLAEATAAYGDTRDGAGAAVQSLRGMHAAVSISYRRAEPDPVFPGLRLEVDYMMFVGVRRPLHLHFVHSADGLRMTLRVHPQALDRETAQRFADGIRAVARSAAADPDTPLAELEVMAAADLERVLIGWNDTARDWKGSGGGLPAAATLPALFAAQATATPDAAAVLDGCRSLSYAALDGAAARLARRLVNAGVQRGDLVAVHLRRSGTLAAVLLAVHRAGAAYLPLDPDHPAERIAMILDDARPRLLVTEKPAPAVRHADALFVDEHDVAVDDGVDPVALPAPALPGEVAYVIYTSGSTGRPKGVEVEHRSLVNLLLAMRERLGSGPADAWLALTSPAFDIFALELYLPLVTGGRVVVAPPGAQRRPEALAELAAREGVSHVQATPSVWRLLLPGGVAGATALVGGEALPAGLAGELRGRFGQVVNVYGPTETTIWSTCAEVGEAVTIGRPIANTQVYLLDESLQPVPVGVAGEMCIGGDGVARGYRGLPGRTAAQFVPDPFGPPGARLYRTGDLARWRDDGEIEFIGRRDGQVKLLGHRIELGEVEARLREHPGVREAVVVLHDDGTADPRLVAYVVPANGAAPGAGELRARLAAVLPTAALPSAYLTLDALPLNPVGKLDRTALPEPPPRGAEGQASGPRADDAPAGRPGDADLAARVTAIWREVLDFDDATDLSPDDDLFDLGGHSLLITQITARIDEQTGIDISLDAVFDNPTINGMITEINRLRAHAAHAALGGQADGADGAGSVPSADGQPATLRPRPAGTVPPLSFAQERLWFLHQFDPDDAAYNVFLVRRLAGALDLAALSTAIDGVVARHETLRTSFPNVDGEPAVVVHPEASVPVELIRLSGPGVEEEAKRLVAERTNTPFRLEDGPLLRVTLIELAPGDHVLCVVLHHIVCDGVSINVLFDEVSALYQARVSGSGDGLAPLWVQYGDFAWWQRTTHSHWEATERAFAYWRRQLADLPRPELPAGRAPGGLPERQGRAGRAEVCDLRVAPDVSAALERTAAGRGVTLFMLVLAAYHVLLVQRDGQPDVLAATVWAMRDRTDLEPLIGDLTDILVLRGDLTGNPTFGELLDRTRKTVLDAHAHRDVPFARLATELGLPRDIDRNPLLTSMLIMHSGEADVTTRTRIGELRADLFEDGFHPAKFDLLLECWQSAEGLYLKVSCDTSLFDTGTGRLLAARFAAILDAVAAGSRDADPATAGWGPRVAALRALPAAERRHLVHDWNETRRDVPSDTVVDLIARRASERPGAAAVSCDGRTLTYAQLTVRAEAAAARLRAAGAGPGALVAVCAEPSVAAVPAMLGVMLAGAGYLPIDPDYPADRIRYALEDSGAALALAPRDLRHLLPPGTAWLDIDEATEPAAELAAEQREHARPAPGDTAYVLYTSGSTGRPKGVVIPHAALANFLAGMEELLDPGTRDVWLGLTSASFDISGIELYLPLTTGGQVVIAGQQVRRDGAALARLVAAHGVTHVQATPTGWRMLLAGGIEAAEVTALVGGEALPTPLARELARSTRRLLNMYGPTETTIWSTCWEVPAQPDRVLIGRPIANTTCYVLDADGELAPPGTPGELFIGGAGVAAGYLGRAALTAERFTPDPYGTGQSGSAGARLYRTGDRVRWTADGQLEFLGRADNQVKVRGFRIELGEVEAALLEHPLVEAACVTVSGDDADARLVACVVTSPPEADTSTLGGYLAGRLPYYMLPGAFVRLDALPLTPNGKVDRRALPPPDAAQAAAAGGGAPPRTATEHRVAAVFAEVLGSPRPSLSDDFFALGGHSLLATKVVALLSAELGQSVPVRELFNHPSVERFAAAVDRLRRGGATAPLTARPAGQAPPVTPGQQRLWFLQRLDSKDTTYNMYLVHRLRGQLDADALAGAVSALTARHEALRTSFPEVDGAPVAVVHPFAPAAVELTDCAGAADPEKAAQLTVNRLVNTAFDLAAAPPFRVDLIRVGADDHVLCIVAHHIVGDAPSLTVLFNDLSRLYNVHRAGAEPDLTPLTVQFGDYAWWRHGAAEPQDAEAKAAVYWRAQLAAPPSLELPGSCVRTQDGHAGIHRFRLGPEATAALERVARGAGATLFTVLLAAYQALLVRHTGQDDILVGTSWATRERVELEPVVGYLTSTLVFRGDLSADPTFAELLSATRRTVLEALEHGDVPFERVIRDLGLPRNARNLLMPTMFILHAPAGDGGQGEAFAGLAVSPFDPEIAQPKFDLALEGWQGDNGLLLVLHYDTGLLPAAQVAGYAARFELLLAGIAAAPEARLSALPLLTGADRGALEAAAHGPGAGADDGDGTAAATFAATADRAPDAPAVICGAQTLSYADLRSLVGRLAFGLANAGPGDVVGVCLPRSPAAIAALLAICRAGAAYLPLDPSYPAERLAALLAGSAARTVITSGELAPRLAALCPAATLLVAPSAALSAGDAGGDAAEEASGTGASRTELAPEPPPKPAAGDPAYLIYTSGSSGRPNGVLVEHGALAARVAWMTEEYRLGPGDVVVQFASLSFDTHAEEVYPALAAGAALLLLPDGPASLPEVLRTEAGAAVTVLDLPTAYWHRLTEMLDDVAWPPGLRLVILGGEQVHAAAVTRWRARFGDQVRLVNTYGPTEATIIATAGDLGAADAALAAAGGRPGIGRPIAQTTAYVLGPDGQLVPPGAAGELCLGGAGLARGYLGDPARTAMRFVPDPFGPPGARLYRTGDRARWRADGTLEFLGRLDNQVKVRGFRVEPGEVEAALTAHPAVGQAAVTADGERLVAYLTGAGGTRVTAEELRGHLAERLPAHLVPSAFVTLDALPLTVNGKVDVAALPAPPPERAHTFTAPRTDSELLVAATWAEVLPAAAGPVGAGDDFFAIGGHSLLAARVASRLRAALEVEVPIRTLFDHPMLADLAAAVEELLAAELDELTDDQAAALVGGEAQ